MTKLPTPDSAAVYEQFSKVFPLQLMNPDTNNGQFIDTHRNPFGFLTRKGITQLRDNGNRFFYRYNTNLHIKHSMLDPVSTPGIHHAQFVRRAKPTAPFAEGSHEWLPRSKEFLLTWNVKVYSTNYLRTVMSAQSFLDGLLGTSCFPQAAVSPIPHGDDSLSAWQSRGISFPPGLSPRKVKEERVPDHSWSRFEETMGTDGEVVVPVTVRDQHCDTLNPFDRVPRLVDSLVGEVMRSPKFIKYDGIAASLAARLSNILPGLIRPHRTDFSARSPSGINWVEAADHFTCRDAHQLPFAAFSDFEHDSRVEQTLAAMKYPTLRHLAWRFRQWYHNARLLATIAAPPLREVVQQMLDTVTRDLDLHLKLESGADDVPAAKDRRQPFVLYSCHDVTILGLLYGTLT
jgi:hypothetical protein